MIITPTGIQRQLGVSLADANNIHSVMLLAYARGARGRWPSQEFETAPDFASDGHLLDRVAVQAKLETVVVFDMYRRAHAEGLRVARRREER